MKKKIGLFIIGFTCAFALNAQIKYGLKGSIGLAAGNGTYGNFAITAQSVVRPSLGLTMDFNGSDKFNWQSGLLINGYGGKYDNENSSTTVSIYTLSIPVFAKYKISDQVYGFGGPQISFSVYGNAQGSEYDSYTKKTTNSSEDINSHIQKPMVFGVVGGGYIINDNLTGIAEYNFGINNVITGEPGAVAKFNCFSLGVIWNLSK